MLQCNPGGIANGAVRISQARQRQRRRSGVLLAMEGLQFAPLLAFGNEDANYFRADMDTLFISFIADALAKLLPRHLPR